MTPATTMTEMLSVSILAVAAGLADPSDTAEFVGLGEQDDPSCSATFPFAAELAVAAAALEEALERG